MPSMLAISMGVSAVPSQADRLEVMVMACASVQAEPLRCSHCAALTERSCGSWVCKPMPLNSATTHTGRGSAGAAGGVARLAVCAAAVPSMAESSQASARGRKFCLNMVKL